MREGGPLIPSISLPYAVINTRTWALMFQNSFNHPIHLKHSQILGHTDTNGPIWTVDSGEYIDWKDLVQPRPRRKSPRLSTPRYVSSEFYTANVAGGEHQSLEQCLNFLAETVTEPNQEIMVPSEALAFDARGKEIPRHRSITEDELWRKIKESNSTHIRREFPDPELEEELPPFAPIPMGAPDEEEVIYEKDVDMN